MLQVHDVRKAYGDVQALTGASLEVAAGNIVSLLGRNGAGKSTLLSIIAGLVRADHGSVVVDGIDVIAKPKQATGLVGIAPQHTGIYPPLSVRENLEFFGELAGLRSTERRSQANVTAERLGLTALLDRKAMKLSGGEARRLHTACALVHRPKVLMLDEPTVGADVTTRAQIIEAVRDLATEGAAILYTTHYLPEVEALDASIVVIDSGRVLTTGTRAELIAAHRTAGIRFETSTPLTTDLLVQLRATEVSANVYQVDGVTDLAAVFRQLTDAGVAVASIAALTPDLESVFTAITGATLVEAPA